VVFQPFYDVSSHQLECTIDIAGCVSEKECDKAAPPPAVQSTDERIASRGAIANYKIHIIDEREELLHFRQVELTIRVGEENTLLRCRCKPTENCRSIALIGVVLNQSAARESFLERHDHSPRSVTTPIVYNNDFITVC
jgi:hypothetical protein